MNGAHGHMRRETGEAPEVVRRQYAHLAAPLRALVDRLRATPPRLVVTCARGSSAHAATFGKHLIEHRLGLPVAAAAPNIASVYGRQLQLKGQLFLAISQSGSSDDLVAQAEAARAAGAVAVALVNAPDSPLAAACDVALPMGAGPELSIAATKSFVAALTALMHLTALWAEDRALAAALERLPDYLQAAAEQDWSAAQTALADAASLVVIGRGPTLAIAREAALKLKETCNIHAEAFSGAEFRHGPIALVERCYPILMFMPSDEAAAGMRRLADDLERAGAELLIAEPPGRLPAIATGHADADAVCLIQSFYAMCVPLAMSRGIDLDRPRHLHKVTRTL